MPALDLEPYSMDPSALIALDKRHLCHPFTQMSDWCADTFKPIILTGGKGAILTDIHGREYIDGNASIWTNIHGHNHPRINQAIKDQLDRVAHTSFLGFTHPAAPVLARELVQRSPPGLDRVFFSDDGSTANEASLRMAIQYRQLRGETRQQFVAFEHAYHGDTLGAATLSGIDLFNYRVKAPFPHVHRVSSVDELRSMGPDFAAGINAAIIEPIIRGPAAMRPWPHGLLRELADWCTEFGVLLILDEVMTGFGRTGAMFACEQENVTPDFLNLAKGITGGYLPLAATLTTDRIFDTFLGHPDRTFYYGHSYTANPLACAAALASLAIFDEEQVLASLPPKIQTLTQALATIATLPNVIETRQRGLAAAVEFRALTPAAAHLASTHRLGAAICDAARPLGLLTRPIGNSVILLLPLCITSDQIRQAATALSTAASNL
jgi:adenosylmethionine-8-amino-7-oxononanoate aminotransferase